MSEYRNEDRPREWLSEEEFKARYKRDDWKVLRSQAMKRDGYACTVCGKGGKLDVHHTPEAYAMFGHERLEDLVTLCKKHHPKGRYSKFEIKQDREAYLELKIAWTIIVFLWRWTVKGLKLGWQISIILCFLGVYSFIFVVTLPMMILIAIKATKKFFTETFWEMIAKVLRS